MRHRSCGDDRIAIIGAGPAGLAVAHFLRQRGYKDVLVLERLGRVGGMCHTITEDYKSFDLGANYLTPAYRETLRLARRHGITTYVERTPVTIEIPDEPEGYRIRSIWKSAREKASFWKLVWAAIKYTWLRFRLKRVIDRPGFRGVAARKDLCVSFDAWLDGHGLGALKRLFRMPITIMGYGYLDKIAAPYALKYMSLSTFVPMMFRVFPPTGWLVPWPKRFELGYQRLWEAVSWDLNVRTNVDIQCIARSEGKIYIKFRQPRQILNEIEPGAEEIFTFDHLIIACPLDKTVLEGLLDQDEKERAAFADTETYSYCLTSMNVVFPKIHWQQQLFATIPLTPLETPWAITRQFEESTMMQFYTRLAPGDEKRAEKRVRANIEAFVERLGGEVDKEEWQTYDRWPYFQHVTPEVMASGFYDRLEDLQGHRNTYYTGGLMNFELVEQIIAYGRDLVARYFPGERAT